MIVTLPPARETADRIRLIGRLRRFPNKMHNAQGSMPNAQALRFLFPLSGCNFAFFFGI